MSLSAESVYVVRYGILILNVQESISDFVNGILIETNTRIILNRVFIKTKGKQTAEEIAEDTGLSITEVE